MLPHWYISLYMPMCYLCFDPASTIAASIWWYITTNINCYKKKWHVPMKYECMETTIIERYITWIFEALAHITRNCKKCSYLPYTLQLFFTTGTIFSMVLYMGNDFRNDFFRKIFAVLCVVCKAILSGNWLPTCVTQNLP